MNLEGKVLDLIFRQVSPDRIVNHLKAPYDQASGFLQKKYDVFSDEKLFTDFAESTLSGYTSHEQRLIYYHLKQQKSAWDKQHGTDVPLLLAALFQSAQNLFELKGHEPVCKEDMLLEWRERFLRLGQDMFVCAFFAGLDPQYGTCTDFTWPAIIRMKDSIMDDPDKVIAENHNHLSGGTFGYQVSWCREMNYPEYIRTELIVMKKSKPLFMKKIRYSSDSTMDFMDRLELAAHIRAILFRALHRKDFSAEGTFDGEAAFVNEYLYDFSPRDRLQDVVEKLRQNYGQTFDYPSETGFCLDYALEKNHNTPSLPSVLLQNGKMNPELRALIGERYFLYQCMMACMKPSNNAIANASEHPSSVGSDATDSAEFTNFEQQLFYLYLLLQTNFRSEMIQTNEETGFHNFAEYQDRKDDAWDKNAYFWEASRIAINYRLRHEHLQSMEGRNAPKPNPDAIIDKIKRFDKAKLYADYELAGPSASTFLAPASNWVPDLEILQTGTHGAGNSSFEKYYYIYHFIKMPENTELDPDAFAKKPVCRHEKLRKKQQAAAVGLAKALTRSAYIRRRIRGIDAANEEFTCRPEVFATIFRYMMGVQQNWNKNTGKNMFSLTPIKLNKTFHTGEDFEDIADGLRYIDEAMEYLDYESGNRVGHALALGTEPQHHYETKGFEVVTTKQDHLDDLVWLLHRSEDYHAQLDASLREYLKTLEKEAKALYLELYDEPNTDLHQYWYSMRLRGDEPKLYKTGTFTKPGFDGDEMTPYLYKSDSALNGYRNCPFVAKLYSRYHYDVDVRKKGKETCIFQVTEPYMRLIRAMQDAMMKVMIERNIKIECNLSSNVLIGTFKDYLKHPILRFYDPASSADQKHLNVSINTDDLGVFDTSLAFEYDLLYRMLKEMKNDDGTLRYTDKQIQDYLEKIREMGLDMVF